MKASWQTLNNGLDQLIFLPFQDGETPQDRADAIDTFLTANGWSWNQYLDTLAKEPL